MQRLLHCADRVRNDVRDYVIEHLGDRDGVLIADETGCEGGHLAPSAATATHRADETCQRDHHGHRPRPARQHGRQVATGGSGGRAPRWHPRLHDRAWSPDCQVAGSAAWQRAVVAARHDGL